MPKKVVGEEVAVEVGQPVLPGTEDREVDTLGTEANPGT